MELNETTKKAKRNYILFKTLSVALTFLPLIVYVIIAFVKGAPLEKFTMGCMVTIALCFVILNVLMKYNIRSTVWVLILGIYLCLDNITPLLIIMAISTILDEFVVSKLATKYKNKFIINKEIDKRG